MLILHAAQSDVGLLFWGETALSKPIPGTPAGSRKKVVPQPSPCAASPELLEALLKKHFRLIADATLLIEAAAWLPSTPKAPVPSSHLIGDLESPAASLVLSPWLTPAYLLEGETLLAVLFGCCCKRTLARGVVIGNDLAYWAEMIRYAGALVARQQYLPSVRTIGGDFHAVWDPVIVADDQERLFSCAKGMPQSARALANPDQKGPPTTAAVQVLTSFLTDAVDALVRSANRVSARLKGRRPRQPVPAQSVHDAWMAALGSEEGLIDWPRKEVEALQKDIVRWKRPVAISTASPVRLCFRLEEPTAGASTGKDTWQVSYLLQPHNDRSLLVPLADLWTAKKGAAGALKHLGPKPKEYVLVSLGQASGISPHVAASLKGPAPNGFLCDTKAAHEFLTQTAPALEQAGFGVMLPAWWTRTGTKLRPVVRAHVESPKFAASGGLSLDAIVEFNWEASLGDARMSIKDLLALAKLKAPLMQIRGQWVEVNADEIAAAVAFWKKKATETATVRDIIHMALGGQETTHGFAFGGVEATGWIQDFLKQLEGKAAFEELPAPASLSATLRPYQVRGFSWLSFLRQWGLGACLADDMGLGKTIQTLTLLLQGWEANGKKPSLLICPTSVVNNWVQEAARFAPGLPVMVHHGITRKKDASFEKIAPQHALVISSYGLLQRDVSLFGTIAWGGVILDEAQNIKNPETKQAKAARAITADFRIALTGTPVENNVGDLWSIMEFLNPGFLGSQAEFRRRFFIPIQTGRDPEAPDKLKRLTGPFVLRRVKTDKTIIADLPDKVERKTVCHLTKEQASLYAAVLKDLEKVLAEVDGIQRKGIILATLSKLKQVCNHPAQFLGDNSAIPDRSGKLSRLTDMLEEVVEAGDKALVFTQFKEMGDILKVHLQETFGREMLFLHGSVTKNQRDKMVERFQTGSSAPPIFILSLKAGGTGLNLTNANHVFHYDRWWNPAVENQATDRAFRIGQHKNVLVHKFLCVGTLEDKIDAMIERKKEVADTVVGSGEAWLTELSNAEIKDLFALRKEALED
ncbi:DEAD/DEAH box helicase [Solidesulfovibrio aerotolerans]|uniref:DEAD/DEAH box helicase n=1 Tax=Solidesulfovibrio aerotolerans TaxID=295255 RepID=UPI001FE4C86E|nr:DEAD/DEAH box helicase [Solidesulfovibrio aerotolerans]